MDNYTIQSKLNNIYTTIQQQINQQRDSILNTTDQLNRQIDCDKSELMHYIDNINQQLISQQYILDSLKSQLSTILLMNNGVKLDEQDTNNSIMGQLQQQILKSQEQLDKLVQDYSKTKAYLDNIDDTLDMFETIITNITQENETLFMGLIRMKTEFDAYITSAIKEKVVLTSSISVLIHNLIMNGVINVNDYTHNFTNIANEIVNVYKKNGIDLDLSEELKAFDGSTFSEDHIAIRIPNIHNNAAKNDDNETTLDEDNEESNIISLYDLKKLAADKKRLKIKTANNKKKKPNNPAAKNNIIENISEKLKALKDQDISIDFSKQYLTCVDAKADDINNDISENDLSENNVLNDTSQDKNIDNDNNIDTDTKNDTEEDDI